MGTRILKGLRIATQIATPILVAYVTSACSNARLIPLVNPPQQATVSLRIINYCPNNGFSYSETFALNTSSSLEANNWVTDTDRDGLSDREESQPSTISTFNIGPLSADTDNDSYSDLVVHFLGLIATSQASLTTCLSTTTDTDSDGLTDCEERVLRTDQLKPDSDDDGIPDGLEVRFGTNPLDNADSISDSDHDGVGNLQEIKANTPISVTNDTVTNSRAVQYSLSQSDAAPCYTVEVSNIPLMDVTNGNVMKVMVTESKSVVGVGNVTQMSSVTVVVPRTTQPGVIIEVDGISNQLVNGFTTPLNLVNN